MIGVCGATENTPINFQDNTKYIWACSDICTGMVCEYSAIYCKCHSKNWGKWWKFVYKVYLLDYMVYFQSNGNSEHFFSTYITRNVSWNLAENASNGCWTTSRLLEEYTSPILKVAEEWRVLKDYPTENHDDHARGHHNENNCGVYNEYPSGGDVIINQLWEIYQSCER